MSSIGTSQIVNHISKWLRVIVGWPSFLRRLQWHTINNLLAVQDGLVVIDLGAGSMQYSAELAKRGDINVIAVDLFLPDGSEKWGKENGIEVVRANGQKLPFLDDSIDRILMSSFLHMVPEPRLVLDECYRVLNNEGYIVLSVPNNYQFIPRLYTSGLGKKLAKLLKFPKDYTMFIDTMNKKFQVDGPKGYYSQQDLQDLLKSSHFSINTHQYAPGWLGSLLWEIGIITYYRFGNIIYRLLFAFYPIARLYDLAFNSSSGSEHIIKGVKHEH